MLGYFIYTSGAVLNKQRVIQALPSQHVQSDLIKLWNILISLNSCIWLK